MFVVARFDIPAEDAEDFLGQAREALAALGARAGFRSGRVGRSVDEPGVWTVLTEWEGVGAYRRALSAYDVKVRATPLLARARDEASAFETLLHDDGVRAVTTTSDRQSDVTGPGNRGGDGR
ncbi:MAG: antibiotic biosynthesis monooxygenase [Geodermatophilaceae bacterium]|nr:antibiotic biosynthesis monooxygenase [Geodermatophilaceae bacterium]MDQ3464565.1 antibiotic biosynthesis monooxygenase [Actinomycetota bacterium]